jgi:hypothetical protein
MMLPARIVFVLLGAGAISAAISTAPAVHAISRQSDLAAARLALARARTAMGGAELAKINSLRVSSTQKHWTSRGQPRARPQTLVVQMLLPSYVLFEQEGDPRRGWAVDTPIASPNEPDASKARLQEDFAYVALRTVLRTDTPFPLTPRAFANGSLEFDTPNGVKVYLDLDPRTHLPSRLHFVETARTNAGDPIPGRTVANRWDLEDYRAVGNVRLAHRWTWYRNEMILIADQTTALELNPPLTPRDFVR